MAVVADCFEHGLLLNASRPDRLRFMPALDVHRSEIDTMLEILAAAVGRVSATFNPVQRGAA